MPELKNVADIEYGGVIKASTGLENKTGNWRMEHPEIDDSRCINCMLCVLQCPENCIKMTEDGKRGPVDLNYCKGCDVCASVCPVKCIIMKREEEI